MVKYILLGLLVMGCDIKPKEKKEVSLTIEQWMVLHENSYLKGGIWAMETNFDEDKKKLDSLQLVATLKKLESL